MSSLDLIVLAILFGSCLLGLMRGLIKEVFSLAAWILAFLAARLLGPVLAPMLPGAANPALQYAAALVLVFVVVMVGASLLGRLLAGIVSWVGLGSLDRALGVAFGAARGVAAIIGLTLLAGLTALPKTETWKVSMTRPALEGAAKFVNPMLPRDLATLIHYS